MCESEIGVGLWFRFVGIGFRDIIEVIVMIGVFFKYGN